MALVDSIDKVVYSYFANISRDRFVYKGKEFEPRLLTVSPLLLRDYTCPEFCGGCCFRFSLDYLPSEPKPESVAPRVVSFNSHDVVIYSDLQVDHVDHFCRQLNKTNGRCNIYPVRPFTCDFELIRFFASQEKARLSQQLYGRGWAFTQISGAKGAMCEMLPADTKSKQEVHRKLLRLQEWATHFGISTWVPEILDWVASNPQKALKLG